MGGRYEPDHSNDEAVVAAIKAAVDRGITHIDTAESYGAGHSEELVAEATKGYDREKLIIATKVSGDHQQRADLLKSFEASLKRLNTNYVDLYLLHRYPNPGTPIAETMQALDELVEQGAIKNIGVCNLTVKRLEEAQKHTKNKIVYNQLHYSLECREPVARGIIKYCQENDILVSAWGPLSKGTLQNAPILEETAKKYGKTPYQVALNWLISQPNVITIPKTVQLDHLEENLGTLGWSLTNEDMQILNDNFPNQLLVSDRVPLDYAADTEP